MDTYVLRGRARPTASRGHRAGDRPDGRQLLDAVVDWDGRCDVDSRRLRGVHGGRVPADPARDLRRRARADSPATTSASGRVAGTDRRCSISPTPVVGRHDDPAGPRPRPDVVAAALDRPARTCEGLRRPGGLDMGPRSTRSRSGSRRSARPGSCRSSWYFNPAACRSPAPTARSNNNYYRISGVPGPGRPGLRAGRDRELFDVTNGPSYRLLIDMSDLDGARIVITTGQSGNPFDPHYGDLIPLWADGATVPLPFSRAAWPSNTVQTLTLTPLSAGRARETPGARYSLTGSGRRGPRSGRGRPRRRPGRSRAAARRAGRAPRRRRGRSARGGARR